MPVARTVIFALLFCLAGCSDDNLREQNAALQQEVEQLQQHALVMEYWERQAGIAEACDAVIPLCPPAVTEAGHAAEHHGYRGGSTWTFWSILLLKLAALGTALGSFAAGAWVGYRVTATRRLLPAREELAKARALVERAEVKAEYARDAAKQAISEAQKAKRQLVTHQEALAATQAAYNQLKAETDRLEELKKALSGFN